MSGSVNLGALAAQSLPLPANEPNRANRFSTSEISTISKDLLNSSRLGGIRHEAYVDYPADVTVATSLVNTFDRHAEALSRGDRCSIFAFTLRMSSVPGVYGLITCHENKVTCLAINFLNGQDCAKLQRKLQSKIKWIYNADEAEAVVLDKNERHDNYDVWIVYMLERTLLTLGHQKAKFLELSCQELADALLPKDEVDLNAKRGEYKSIYQRATQGQEDDDSESFKTQYAADIEYMEGMLADFEKRYGIDTSRHTVEEQLKESLRTASANKIAKLREIFRDDPDALEVIDDSVPNTVIFND